MNFVSNLEIVELDDTILQTGKKERMMMMIT
jgi:hypothetical protein